MKPFFSRSEWLIPLYCLILMGASMAPGKDGASTADKDALRRRAVQMLQSGPAVFVENRGQWTDGSVRFALSGGGANVGLTSSTLRFQLFQRQEGAGPADPRLARLPRPGAMPTSASVRMHEFRARLAGARPAAPVGEKQSTQLFHFRRGDRSQWRENVPAYEAVRYAGLYPGVDLLLSGRKGGIKYEFHVAPGADCRQIRLDYEGLAGLKLREDGALELTPAPGWPALVDGAPVIYQEGTDGARRAVAGRFQLVNSTTVGYEVTGAYDKTRPLMIDPELAWSSYLGGSGMEYGYGVAQSNDGGVYVTGMTLSPDWTLSSEPAPPDVFDAFLVKFDLDGHFLWGTFLGGDGFDYGYGITIDHAGNVLVTGYTDSDGWVEGGVGTHLQGYTDAFVVKLSPGRPPIRRTISNMARSS